MFGLRSLLVQSISIHAPREGSDKRSREHPVQRGISIHAPREGSDYFRDKLTFGLSRISIHAPREGSDQRLLLLDLGQVVISIHAPREGSDRRTRCRFGPSRRYFYPRSPRGERQLAQHRQAAGDGFLSTLPARGATRPTSPPRWTMTFLSTLPARGAT